MLMAVLCRVVLTVQVVLSHVLRLELNFLLKIISKQLRESNVVKTEMSLMKPRWRTTLSLCLFVCSDLRDLQYFVLSYKDIDAVMEAQKDLVKIVHTLKQIVCVKG